jgi:SAM-dependent methyltransferase
MMAGVTGEYRLYQELAAWWPLISPAEEYADEAAYLAGLLGSAATPVREVLDLGSGGGHVALHLKDRFAMTLVDLSEDMLAVSRRINPGCAHLQGDMRTIRLGRPFDAVLVHDAVDYVTCEADLRQVIDTAYAHCRPGGLALFVPDHVADTFRSAGGRGGSSDAAGRQASFREWTWDPDPGDDWVRAEYEFVLRAADGTVQVVREVHQLGAFRRETWLRLLAEAGFGYVPPPGSVPPSGSSAARSVPPSGSSAPGSVPPSGSSAPGSVPPSGSSAPGSLAARSAAPSGLAAEVGQHSRRPDNLFIGRRHPD